MQKSYKNNQIRSLRRTPHYKAEIDLNDIRYLTIRYCVPMMIMITVIMISVMMVSATPNSNYPVSI